ncbi:MAG: sortase [Oscillospiraceae bacterium]|nr:sortase [Oscillospiraceae bacterium]
MRSKLGELFMALGALLLVAAVGLLAYNQWDDWRAGRSVADIQDALEAAVEEAEAAATPAPYSGSVTSAADEDEAQDTEMATVEVDGYEYIGTLSIPSYGLQLPVMAQWSYAGLKIAPGRYSGSVWTDDLIICGHNYDRHFGNLKNLEPGDIITFTDVEGNVFDYQVEEIITLQPTDVEEMASRENGEWDLTLFTCTIGGQTRVTVRCSRTSEDTTT